VLLIPFITVGIQRLAWLHSKGQILAQCYSTLARVFILTISRPSLNLGQLMVKHSKQKIFAHPIFSLSLGGGGAFFSYK